MIFNIKDISRSIPAIKVPVRKKAGEKQAAKFKLIKANGEKIKKIAKTIFGNFNLNKNSAKVLLALLYWSSGAKYPSSNFVAFSNSDPRLVKTFLYLLRATFKISEPRIKIHLQLYQTQDQKRMTGFWSKLLSIPEKQFYPPTIHRPPKRPIRPDYSGTCTVRYHSLEILLTIMKLYEELSNTIKH